MKKDSLTKVGGPRVQIESGSDEGNLGIRSLSNDDFEVECGYNVDHQVISHDQFVQMFEERAEETGFEVGHVVVLVPHFFDVSQRKTIREAGALSGVTVCKVCSELKPAVKPRGFQGGCPDEAEARLPGGPVE